MQGKPCGPVQMVRFVLLALFPSSIVICSSNLANFQKSPSVHAQGVHEVLYNNSRKIFIVGIGTVTGQVKLEAVSRIPR